MMREEWGKTRYDDLLKKYRVGRNRLYFILTGNIDEVSKTLKKSKETVREFRNRHDVIVSEFKKY